MSEKANAEMTGKAKALYQDGKTLSEIAALLGVSPSTVRSWKSRGKWDGNTATQRNAAKERRNTERVAKKMVKAVESNEELTDAQKAFCLHYVKTFNATMAYKRAYNCSYDAARSNGPALLAKTCIRAEITRLKAIMAEGILAGPEDVVEKYMQFAFADITVYVEFGRATVPVMSMYGPVQVKDPETGEKVPLTKEINDIRFKESSEVDGTILTEVKQGKDGASVKLAERMGALHWLANYFDMNPNDRHRKEYDKRRLELEMLKVQTSIKDPGSGEPPDDGFRDALNSQAAEVWKDHVG